MNIRLWDGSRIIADLTVHHTGITVLTSPTMPNNFHDAPDMELDPFKGYIKVKGEDVITIDDVVARNKREEQFSFEGEEEPA